ncbi:hypothetical protein BKH43_04750 [Helicobacter sp. 13S00401-1]|uniref:hypothetical protein n=1 Tax=Helicobacter sp. 13S00401-1 TaxID=1905758 RepID=UPI000BA64D5B|nr:hypothetical protein [Helicobacter sp. 13S00401-1]PAF50404.1 hypothetical protein BKH43_04750 [Helicobacter sp. 13S00401-1]
MQTTNITNARHIGQLTSANDDRQDRQKSHIPLEHFPQDVFVKSQYTQKIEGLGNDIKGGLNDMTSFQALANRLQREDILNSHDMIAVKFLSMHSPTSKLEDFDRVLRNENLSVEMRSLIATLINKLHTINYLHSGLLVSA